MKMKMWGIRVEKYIHREEVLTENANKLYGIVIGQCTPPLRLTIKGDSEYGKIHPTLTLCGFKKRLKRQPQVLTRKRILR